MLYLDAALRTASYQYGVGRLACWRFARAAFMSVWLILSAREFSWGWCGVLFL